MKKKETEEYIRSVAKGLVKEQLNSEGKERIWENIKTAVESEKVQPEKKKTPIIRYSVISCAAACVLIVLLAVAAKQYIFDNPAPITGDSTLNIDSSSSETSSKVNSTMPAISESPLLSSKPAGTVDAPLIEIRPQNIIVINHRLYQYKKMLRLMRMM